MRGYRLHPGDPPEPGRARGSPRGGARFAIIPGHQILEADRVVEENGRFDVVEKTDGGRRVAEAKDPR
jgi:hypothetical protein